MYIIIISFYYTNFFFELLKKLPEYNFLYISIVNEKAYLAPNCQIVLVANKYGDHFCATVA